MNIKNVEDAKNIPENIWEAIWDKQRELAVKYQTIENMGNLLMNTDNNINTANGQKWIKDFAWRITEELTEADEALNIFCRTSSLADMWIESEYRIHYLEEVTDALHFFVELAIIAGYEQDFFEVDALSHKQVTSYDVIYQMGLMCNCLKNKPWKQTQMLTDKEKFEKYLKEAFNKLCNLFYEQGLADVDIYQFYFKKNAVNKFRIRSKY